MAPDAANNITCFLSVSATHKNELAAVRHWINLRVGFEDDLIWVRDLDYAQINSPELKIIASKKIYYEKEGSLYLLNSLLPERKVPALLWTVIDRALPVQLPSYNHNFFGISEDICTRLVSAGEEKKAAAMIVSADLLGKYLDTAPAVRLKNMHWVILNDNLAFIFGSPSLPLPATVFWKQGYSLFPSGYAPEFPVLAETMEKLLNLQNDLLVWNTDSTYFIVEKNDLQPLSLGSFRNSMKNLSVL